ncbi:MAG: 30S ribosomal protein S3 [Candidatus Altiarchaeota archaeon]
MALERYFIQEGVIRSEVENFLRNELNRAGYSGINIQKTPLSTRVILYVEKPPLVIGKKGRRINKLTYILSEKYGIDNPSIDVQKIEEPMLDPNIISRRIAVALERGINRRRVVYRALRAVMGSNARGVEIVLSGKIVGKGGRSRQEKYSQGYMKKAGDSVKFVRIGSTQAYLKAGVIGVTVKIVPPDAVFPDQIFLKTAEKAKEPVPEKTVEESPKKEEPSSQQDEKEKPKVEEKDAKQVKEESAPKKDSAKTEKAKPAKSVEKPVKKEAVKAKKEEKAQDKKAVKDKEEKTVKKTVKKKASDKKTGKEAS